MDTGEARLPACCPCTRSLNSCHRLAAPCMHVDANTLTLHCVPCTALLLLQCLRRVPPCTALPPLPRPPPALMSPRLACCPALSSRLGACALPSMPPLSAPAPAGSAPPAPTTPCHATTSPHPTPCPALRCAGCGRLPGAWAPHAGRMLHACTHAWTLLSLCSALLVLPLPSTITCASPTASRPLLPAVCRLWPMAAAAAPT